MTDHGIDLQLAYVDLWLLGPVLLVLLLWGAWDICKSAADALHDAIPEPYAIALAAISAVAAAVLIVSVIFFHHQGVST